MPSFTGLLVKGSDATTWLNAQMTQALHDVSVGDRVWSCLAKPTGQIEGIYLVQRLVDAWHLTGSIVSVQAMQTRIEAGVILEDVLFEPLALSNAGLGNEEQLLRAGIPGEAELKGPVLAPELGSRFMALAVSDNKGCYPGQEVFCRIRDRGHVNRQWVVFEAQTPLDVLPDGVTLIRRIDLQGGPIGHSCWVKASRLESLASCLPAGTQIWPLN